MPHRLGDTHHHHHSQQLTSTWLGIVILPAAQQHFLSTYCVSLSTSVIPRPICRPPLFPWPPAPPLGFVPDAPSVPLCCWFFSICRPSGGDPTPPGGGKHRFHANAPGIHQAQASQGHQAGFVTAADLSNLTCPDCAGIPRGHSPALPQQGARPRPRLSPGRIQSEGVHPGPATAPPGPVGPSSSPAWISTWSSHLPPRSPADPVHTGHGPRRCSVQKPPKSPGATREKPEAFSGP